MIKQLKRRIREWIMGIPATGTPVDNIPLSTHEIKMDEPIMFNDWIRSVYNQVTQIQKQ